MLKLCIFDMDGTVVDSLHSIAWFANQALEHHGLSPFPVEAYKTLVGNGAKVLVQRMVTEKNALEQFESVYREYVTSYDADPLHLAVAYEGVPEMLAELRRRGVAIAILSNKPNFATRSIAKAIFGDSIDACFGGRPDVPLKPSPDAVLQLLQLFGVSKEECLYIGDTGTDMQTAKNAGLFAVGVLWGFRGEDELRRNGADAIIAHPLQLLNVADTYVKP